MLLISFALTSLADPQKQFPFESFRDCYFNRLAGLRVENQDGQAVGHLKDCVLNAQTGELRYLVVTGGGLFGWGQRSRLVPAGALTAATAKKGVLALNLSRAQWRQTPVLRSTTLADIKRSVVDHHPSRSATTNVAVHSQPDHRSLAPVGRQSHESAHAIDFPNLQLTTDLLGRTVTRRQRQKLGEVSDLILDLSGTRPVFAIVSRRAFLRKPEKFAVPLRSLSLAAGGGLSLEIDEAELARAPVFSEERWRKTGKQPAPVVFRILPPRTGWAGHPTSAAGLSTSAGYPASTSHNIHRKGHYGEDRFTGKFVHSRTQRCV